MSNRDRKALVAEYLEGAMPVNELAKKHGITRQGMYCILQREGVTKRHRKGRGCSGIDEDTVLSLYSKSKDMRQVAKDIGTTITNVHTILRKHNAVERKSKYRKVAPEWKRAYENGDSLYRISQLYDTDVGTVRSHLIRVGTVMRTTNRTPIRDDIKKMVLTMKKESASLSNIAATTGISVSSVKNIIRSNNAASDNANS